MSKDGRYDEHFQRIWYGGHFEWLHYRAEIEDLIRAVARDVAVEVMASPEAVSAALAKMKPDQREAVMILVDKLTQIGTPEETQR